MKIIKIDMSNIDEEHVCCAIGNDKTNQSRALSKKNWMKERFQEGLIFKRLDDRGKIFIEYMPIETVWKPIIGQNYMVINCLWVSGKFKGQGISTKLLDECINDSQKLDKAGIAVVSSNKVKPFMTDKKFYLHHGFEVVDTARPYFELLVLKFDKNAPNPAFTPNAIKGSCDNQNGFTFVYSNQCPFMQEYVNLLGNVCKNKTIPYKIVHLENYKQAQQQGSPFGTLGIYYNGQFQTHELMPEKKFERFIDEII